ncbi:MAG: Uncharacterized protein XD94_0720 [Mesotoga prima]|jgi:hypothetical protein|uniref:Uncharacterized protein n=1 Tax=Mesotoga prima TaxID=1184387 RepID=A0A101HQ95_9BACT|nr:MAG: Uncharacterized protein XD94_0720 [Mesotoga prima]
MFLPHWASQAITKDWTYLASPASLILTNNEGRLFTALSGFSAFKRASVLMLATRNRQLAAVLARAVELVARSATVLMFCITCVSWLFLPLLAVTGLSLKLRLAPRSGTGEASTGGDGSRLLTGLRKQTGCSSLTLP